MTKKNFDIKEMNRKWVLRKVKYEKAHKYAGSPEIMLDRVWVDVSFINQNKSK